MDIYETHRRTEKTPLPKELFSIAVQWLLTALKEDRITEHNSLTKSLQKELPSLSPCTAHHWKFQQRSKQG